MQQLNFAKAPFRNERLPMLLYSAAVAVLLALSLIHGVILTRYLLREQEELDVKVEALEKERADLSTRIRRTDSDLDSQRSEAHSERIRFLAGLYRQKSFSWTGLFNELESLTPPSVRIISISPGQIGRSNDEIADEIEVRLEVVARSRDDILEMIGQLEKNRFLTTVLPRSETEGSEGGGVAASLTLQYVRPSKQAQEADPPQARTQGNAGADPTVTFEAVPPEGSSAPTGPDGSEPRGGR